MSWHCGPWRRAENSRGTRGPPRRGHGAIDRGYAESARASPEPLVRRAARVRRAHRRAGSGGRVLLSRGFHRAAGLSVRHPARRPRLRQPACLVADSAACAERPAGGAHDPVSAGNGRAQAGGGVQGIRTRAADRAPRNRHCLVRHPQPRRRPWPGGASDRDRQRPRSPCRPPGQARRTRDGQCRDRRRRELRRDQHAPRLAASGRVPDDGGGRDRRRDARSGARARAARCRRRLADLHRARRLDRPRHLLARGPGHPCGRHPRCVRVSLGDRDRRHRGDPRRRHQAAGAAAPADRRTPNGAADTCCRRRDRCDRADLRRSNREKLGRGALLGTGSAPGPDRRRCRLDRGRAPDGRPLQGPRVQPLAEQLPRRPHLPEPCSSALPAALRSRTFPACR